MKSKTTILFFVLYSTMAFSQNYLHESASWNESTVGCPPIGLCYYEDYTITLGENIVIDGKTYYRTLRKGTETVEDWVNNVIVAVNDIDDELEPIREEDGKIYRYRFSSEEEILLHDFNLEIGDTAISTCFDAQIVDSIETVWMGNIQRKKFYFQNNSSNTLYEGIGSSKGLFKTPCNAIGIESGSRLKCYGQEGYVIQIDPDSDCEITVDVENIENENVAFKVLPNPFDAAFDLQFSEGNERPEAIRVINLQGIEFYRSVAVDSGLTQKINLNDAAAGIYLVQVYYSDRVVSQKVIKGK